MVVIDLVPLLAAFVAFAVCYALLVAYRSTIGAMLAALAAASYSISVLGYHPFHWLGDGIKALDSTVNNALASAVQGTEYAWGKVLHANAVLIHDATAALGDLAEATEARFRHLPAAITQTIVPAWVWPLRATVSSLTKLLAREEGRIAKLEHAAATTVSPPVARVVHDATKVTNVTIQAAVAAIPSAVGLPWPRVGRLEGEVTGIERWIRSHTKLLAEAGIAGALITALSRAGLSWTRCSNTNAYGKNLCGMDRNLLESLIADTLAVLGTVSLVEFAEGMQDLTGEAAETIGTFWRA